MMKRCRFKNQSCHGRRVNNGKKPAARRYHADFQSNDSQLSRAASLLSVFFCRCFLTFFKKVEQALTMATATKTEFTFNLAYYLVVLGAAFSFAVSIHPFCFCSKVTRHPEY